MRVGQCRPWQSGLSTHQCTTPAKQAWSITQWQRSVCAHVQSRNRCSDSTCGAIWRASASQSNTNSCGLVTDCLLGLVQRASGLPPRAPTLHSSRGRSAAPSAARRALPRRRRSRCHLRAGGGPGGLGARPAVGVSEVLPPALHHFRVSVPEVPRPRPRLRRVPARGRGRGCGGGVISESGGLSQSMATISAALLQDARPYRASCTKPALPAPPKRSAHHAPRMTTFSAPGSCAVCSGVTPSPTTSPLPQAAL